MRESTCETKTKTRREEQTRDVDWAGRALTCVSQTLVVMICSRSCCREEEKLLRRPRSLQAHCNHPRSFPCLPKPWDFRRSKHKHEHILAVLT